jgi:hypothetical protein
MKGMELPINMIVVVLIAVLVLVTVSTFLAGQLGGGGGAIELERAFSEGCQKLRSQYNCNTGANIRIMSYTLPGYAAGSGSTFFGTPSICSQKGYTDTECARMCGCTNVPAS